LLSSSLSCQLLISSRIRDFSVTMSDAYQCAINAVQNDLPTEVSSLCQAIRDNDEKAVQTICSSLHEELTVVPKKLAIDSNKPRILQILLEKDEFIDDSLMRSACEGRNRGCIDMLLTYGWDINKPLYPAGSPLW
jgi:hypothetical protein